MIIGHYARHLHFELNKASVDMDNVAAFARKYAQNFVAFTPGAREDTVMCYGSRSDGESFKFVRGAITIAKGLRVNPADITVHRIRKNDKYPDIVFNLLDPARMSEQLLYTAGKYAQEKALERYVDMIQAEKLECSVERGLYFQDVATCYYAKHLHFELNKASADMGNLSAFVRDCAQNFVAFTPDAREDTLMCYGSRSDGKRFRLENGAITLAKKLRVRPTDITLHHIHTRAKYPDTVFDLLDPTRLSEQLFYTAGEYATEKAIKGYVEKLRRNVERDPHFQNMTARYHAKNLYFELDKASVDMNNVAAFARNCAENFVAFTPNAREDTLVCYGSKNDDKVFHFYRGAVSLAKKLRVKPTDITMHRMGRNVKYPDVVFNLLDPARISEQLLYTAGEYASEKTIEAYVETIRAKRRPEEKKAEKLRRDVERDPHFQNMTARYQARHLHFELDKASVDMNNVAAFARNYAQNFVAFTPNAREDTLMCYGLRSGGKTFHFHHGVVSLAKKLRVKPTDITLYRMGQNVKYPDAVFNLLDPARISEQLLYTAGEYASEKTIEAYVETIRAKRRRKKKRPKS